MKWFAGITALALLAAVQVARADEELKSGPQPGDRIGAFDVVKCAGAADDGVGVGDKLCYRCRYGTKPMVMVFTRKSGDGLAPLVKELDSAVASHSDKQLKAFVNIVGENREAAEAAAKQFGEKNKFANVPIVVPEESENGPDNYGINPKAEVTIIVATGGKVTASHGFSGIPDSAQIQEILGDVSKAVQ
jgi:hypothetical protein